MRKTRLTQLERNTVAMVRLPVFVVKLTQKNGHKLESSSKTTEDGNGNVGKRISARQFLK